MNDDTTFDCTMKAVKAVLFALIVALAAMCVGVAVGADPIVGKPIAYPPAWFAGLSDYPGVLPAVPSPSFPLPQQNYQRSPVVGLLRLCSADNRRHASVTDPYKKILTGVCPTTLDVAVEQVFGGMLFGSSVPTAAAGHFVIHSNPSAELQIKGWARTDVISPFVLQGVKASWVDPVTPVLNIVPIGSGDQVVSILKAGVAPDVIDEAISVMGWSPSSAPYQVHAVNAVAAMPARVRESLKAQGRLCQAVAECLYLGVNDATGRVKLGKVYPRIDDLTTLEQHIAIAKAVAKRANQYEAVPLISDFDRWFNANGTGLDRASAKAGWDAAKQSQ